MSHGEILQKFQDALIIRSISYRFVVLRASTACFWSTELDVSAL